MQFIIKQAELMQALNAVKAIYAVKGSGRGRFALDVLNNVLIQAHDEVVHLTTTDMTMRVTYTAQDTVKVAEEGAYTVNYKQLMDVVKVLPKTADITVKQQENTVEIACSGRKFLDGKDAEEFPIWEAVRPAGTVYTKTEDEGTSPRKKVTYTYEVVKTQTQICCLPPAVLGDMLAQVAYAAAEDDSRPVLQTTFVHLKDDRFIIAAADSFRLAELKTEMPGAGSWEHPVLIHAKYFEQIAKLLPKNAAVTIEVTSTEDKLVKKDEETIPDAQPFTTMVEAQFTAENVVVYLRPTDGIYPNYVGMIPKMADTSVICETAELLSGYKAVWPVAKDASNITRMRVAGNMVYIEAKREEQAESTAHEISATRSGPDIQVILNGQYMLDFLKVTKSPEVIIELTKPGRPVLFRPTGGGVEARYVVMPMSSNR